MTQDYIILINNSATIVNEKDLDLQAIQTEFAKNTVLAVKIGRKSYSKSLVRLIAKIECTKSDGHNFGLLIGGHPLSTSVEDADAALTQITEAVNTQQWVLFGNNDILFSRNLFECAESLTINNNETFPTS